MKKGRGDLLLEFFSEEIPARMQLNSEIQLQNLFVKSLTQRDIACLLYTSDAADE